jgi:hypothetical protein
MRWLAGAQPANVKSAPMTGAAPNSHLINT